jgi:hypothetical protein
LTGGAKGVTLILQLEKGKPIERWGRKAMGLKLETARIARLPGFLVKLMSVRIVIKPAHRKVESIFTEAEMQKKIKWISLLIAAVLMMAAVTPVFADTGDEPVEEPVVIEETSSFLDHPIVKLLASFFSNLFNSPAEEESVVVDVVEPPSGDGFEGIEGEGTSDVDFPEGTDIVEPTPTVVPEEVVAALHEEQDLGFGEMTKLLQIVVEAKASCTLEGVNCDVTLDSLLAEYKEEGVGMGQLFQDYGKPEILGVGQVRNAVDPKEKSNNGNAKGKNK